MHFHIQTSENFGKLKNFPKEPYRHDFCHRLKSFSLLSRTDFFVQTTESNEYEVQSKWDEIYSKME
ncbi:CLUMA_CG006654, isoform A [Clunio marinus]|uniref:CLUMA_CG006654, isoform A n=1 Tax=Clunio marinus TaxID=568069 RepID=A0A1J1HZL6_9DIPT|nr:CLUMA_CG006654, isoform A [Clunio marinus]